MEKNYTTKQILLGLRLELLKFQEALNELKKYFIVNENLTISFSVFPKNNINIYLSLKENRNKLVNIIKSFKNYGQGTYILEKNKIGQYQIKQIGKNIITIDEAKREELNREIENILNYPFIQIENNTVTNNCIKSGNDFISIKFPGDATVSYFAKFDAIQIETLKREKETDHLIELLNKKNSSSLLTEDAISAIEKENYQDKPLKISDTKSFSSLCRYKIEESQKEIVLVKSLHIR